MTHARAFSIVSIGLYMAVSAPAAFAEQSTPSKNQKPVFQQVSLTSGRVRGIVIDDHGQAVGGVAIAAMGTTTAVV